MVEVSMKRRSGSLEGRGGWRIEPKTDLTWEELGRAVMRIS